MTLSQKITELGMMYRPAVLKKTKSGYHIEYYALNPQKKELDRIRIKLNRERSKFSRLSDFKEYAWDIVNRINGKLSGGWSPFFDEENTRLYTPAKIVLDLFIREKSKDLRENTMRSYRSFVKMFSDYMDKNAKGIYIGMINRLHAIKYMDYINEKNIAAVTYNNQIKIGRSFFNWCIEKCYSKVNPFSSIKRKREDAKKRILIPEEVRKRITNYLINENPEYLAVLQLIYSSLIRPKEIAEIKIKDIDIPNKVIHIREDVSKTHHQRFSTMSPELLAWFNNQHLDRFPPDYYLFGSDLKPDARKISNARFRKHWDKLRNALQLPQEMQLYSLRDTGINNLLKSGIDPLTVMQHADHHDLSMTTRYANHADPELTNKIFAHAPKF